MKENKELRKKVKKLEKRSARDGDTDAIMTVSMQIATGNTVLSKISKLQHSERLQPAKHPYRSQELRDLELEFESLQKEKLELDQDLERERSQKEEVEGRLEKAEREKVATEDKLERVQNELESIQMEANRSLATTDSEMEGKDVEENRIRELEENVRMKNKQIKQLLEDIEQV